MDRLRKASRITSPERPPAIVRGSAVTAAADHHRPILPRSPHLPLATTDGSLIEKVNKTGVRLWTGCSDILTIVWIVLLIVLGGVRLATWYYEGK